MCASDLACGALRCVASALLPLLTALRCLRLQLLMHALSRKLATEGLKLGGKFAVEQARRQGEGAGGRAGAGAGAGNA